MSTISKLNPKVREDRTMRAALVRELKAKLLGPLPTDGPAAMVGEQLAVAHHFLAHVRRSPWRTGQRKNEIFQQLARELTGNAAT